MGRAFSAVGLCLLLLSSLFASDFSTPEEAESSTFLEMFDGFHAHISQEVWNQTPWVDVAVPEGFDIVTAMDYSDVGIIINNASDVSRAIGWAFVSARNLSSEQVFLIDDPDAPTGETINRNQFNTYFADPFRAMLSDQNHSKNLNYIVTTDGVPLRVSGGNDKASFDQELAMIGGTYNGSIGNNFWVNHDYGPLAGSNLERFTRQEYGFFLVTRLTGYDIETAIGLIEKANNSIGSRGNFVLDKAANRNGGGYKYWNDDLTTANTTLNGTLGLPTMYDDSAAFLTNVSDVIGYASWGSNDGSWGSNFLPNSGFDTEGVGWSSGARFWDAESNDTSSHSWDWQRQGEVKRNGNWAIETTLEQTCIGSRASQTQGIISEYFDNSGQGVNTSVMPNLSGRIADRVQDDSQVDFSVTGNAWAGLDDRFKDHWSSRHSGILVIPESDNWTFYLESDDGSRLWIDGVLVVNNSGIHAMGEQSGSINLSAGNHQFRVEHFEHGGVAGLHLRWESTNYSKQIVPTSAFLRGEFSTPKSETLIHHWSFDNAGRDLVGNANLTLTGGVASQNGCLLGDCLSFDGVDDEAYLNVSDWNSSFSIAMWAKSVGTQNSVILSTNGIDVYSDIGQDWTHITLINDNSTLSIYHDGILVNTSNPDTEIDYYRFGSNGSVYFSGLVDDTRVWNTSLNSEQVQELVDEVAWSCPRYDTSTTQQITLSQNYSLTEDQPGHAWLFYAYTLKQGEIYGNYNYRIDGFDANGVNIWNQTNSDTSLRTTWHASTWRFRPPENVSTMRFSIEVELTQGTQNGSIYFDTSNLRMIRPHMGWVNGSIVDTAVSTGGRSFQWGTGYGQSLVADILEDGASSTKGYVYEPYITAVSYPSVLLSTYAQGYTMAESYYAANRMLGWMGVVVGDPKMAAYADLIHDVHIIDARIDGNLSVSSNGSIQIAVENIGLGESDGWLTVRHRVGGEILANQSLILPAGDEQGSRVIIEMNILSDEAGWNDFLIRYDANESSSNEWVVANNLLTIPAYVNQIPEVIDISCDAPRYTRGSSLMCGADTRDDGNISRLELAWRISSENNSSEWVWMNTGSSNGDEWWTTFQVPVKSELGYLDMKAIAYDDLNISSEEFVRLSVAQILDAQGTWFGPHVEFADPDDWNGATTLPSRTEASVPRGENILVKACIRDPDHELNTEAPLIEVDGTALIDSFTLQSPDDELFCYGAYWTYPIGSAVDDISIELNTHAGDFVRTRAIQIEDLAGILTADLSSGDRLRSDGSDELRVSWIDPDDPETGATGDAIIKWPGSSPLSIPIQLVHGNNTIQIPAALSAIEAGEAEIELRLQGKHGTESSLLSTWHVQLTSPEILSIDLCMGENSLDELYFGKVAIAVVQIDSNRFIDVISVDLKQSGWSIEAPLINPEESATCWNDEEKISKFFRVRLDSTFVKGEGKLVVAVRDRDGLIDSSYMPIEFSNQAPSVAISPPPNASAGNLLSITLNVSDPDGLIDAYCLTKILMPDDTLISEIRTELSGMGVQNVNWPIPSDFDGSISVESSCWDSTDERADSLRKIVIINPSNDSEPETMNETGSSDSSASSTPMIVGASIAGVLFLILVSIIAIRRKGAQENEQSAFESGGLTENSLYEAAWPPQ